jgi:hypothetical protein
VRLRTCDDRRSVHQNDQHAGSDRSNH